MGDAGLVVGEQTDGKASGKYSTALLDLPKAALDSALDIIFDCLNRDPAKREGSAAVHVERRFPCCSELARFALACLRFSRHLRQSWVERLAYDASYKLPGRAFLFEEAVRGLLARFPSAT